MSTVHEEFETGRAKLDAAVTIAVDAWYRDGAWFEDDSGRWAFVMLLERALGHLEAAA